MMAQRTFAINAALALRRIVLLGLWAAIATLCGCGRAAPDSTPEGVVRLWLEKMEDSSLDPLAGKEAYGLLSQAAQKNLKARADRDGPRQGRRIQPHEMLADGRFGLRFRPKRMQTTIAGDRATVDVRGDDASEQATVYCTREQTTDPKGNLAKLWRIELELPDVIPLTRRADGGM